MADLVEKAEEEKESEKEEAKKVEVEKNGVEGETEEEEVAAPVEAEEAPLTQVIPINESVINYVHEVMILHYQDPNEEEEEFQFLEDGSAQVSF